MVWTDAHPQTQETAPTHHCVGGDDGLHCDPSHPEDRTVGSVDDAVLDSCVFCYWGCHHGMLLEGCHNKENEGHGRGHEMCGHKGLEG